MEQTLTAWQIRLLRLRAQRLLPEQTSGRDDPAQVLAQVGGVQAQELPAALLSVRARSTGLTVQEVERARTEERSIVWTWAMRGTLHLIVAEDAPWLLALLGPKLINAGRRRLEELGWDEGRTEAGLRLLQSALRDRSGLTRPQIAQLFKENGLPAEGQAPIHLIYRATLEGRLCYGPDREGAPTFVSCESWLPDPQPLSRSEALACLARRYLGGYGPAGPEDLARWSGLGSGEARKAWGLIAAEIVTVKTAEGETLWLLKEQAEAALPWLDELVDRAKTPSVRLLPRYDTYWLGYVERALALDPAFAKRVHPGGGVIHPVLLVEGQARGNWKTRRRKGVLEVQVQPFESLPDEALPPLEAEAADLGRFLGERATLAIEGRG
jgi:hypothetical protein